MRAKFHRLNEGWNAEPYAPRPVIEIRGADLLLSFHVNALQFTEFHEGEIAVLRFVRGERYRLGPTNDDGWYGGLCRFSKLAPEWGEFYTVQGASTLLDAPQDWHTLAPPSGGGRHFLFYFRDNTFECSAEHCLIDAGADNALRRAGKSLHVPSPADLRPSPHYRRRLCRSR